MMSARSSKTRTPVHIRWLRQDAALYDWLTEQAALRGLSRPQFAKFVLTAVWQAATGDRTRLEMVVGPLGGATPPPAPPVPAADAREGGEDAVDAWMELFG